MSFIIESATEEYPTVIFDENYVKVRQTIEKKMTKKLRKEYCRKTLLDILTFKISSYEYQDFGFPNRKFNIDDFLELLTYIDDYSPETKQNVKEIIERSVYDPEYHDVTGKHIGKLLIRFDESKDVYELIINYLRLAHKFR